MPRNNGEGRYGGMATLIEFKASPGIQSSVESLVEGVTKRPRFFATGAVLLDYACFIRKGYNPQLNMVEDALSRLSNEPFYAARAELSSEIIDDVEISKLIFSPHESSLVRLNTAVASLQGVEGRIDHLPSPQANYILFQTARSSLLKHQTRLDEGVKKINDILGSTDDNYFEISPQLSGRKIDPITSKN